MPAKTYNKRKGYVHRRDDGLYYTTAQKNAVGSAWVNYGAIPPAPPVPVGPIPGTIPPAPPVPAGPLPGAIPLPGAAAAPKPKGPSGAFGPKQFPGLPAPGNNLLRNTGSRKQRADTPHRHFNGKWYTKDEYDAIKSEAKWRDWVSLDEAKTLRETAREDQARRVPKVESVGIIGPGVNLGSGRQRRKQRGTGVIVKTGGPLIRVRRTAYRPAPPTTMDGSPIHIQCDGLLDNQNGGRSIRCNTAEECKRFKVLKPSPPKPEPVITVVKLDDPVSQSGQGHRRGKGMYKNGEWLGMKFDKKKFM